ncbi:DUF3592 domain-containing protein [Amycolatopsis sp. NPDC059027]|uniref:DUF3592 domain-containing protein n=1 Tax=Amycolatopsis sp. NPDC059027 TaxID=3346709 RepID=UPI00366B0B4F
MGLGFDEQAGPRGNRRNGLVHAVACGVSSLVFVVLATTATWTLATHDQPWEPSAAPVELLLAFTALFSAVFTGVQAWRYGDGGEVASRPSGSAARVPPPPPDHLTTDGIDPDVETRRLRALSWRAMAVVLLWIAVLAGAVWGMNAQIDAAERLLATGTRVSGSVLSVHNPRKGTPTMEVSYLAGGTVRTATIVRDGTDAYVAGQALTVVYDPADPGRVRTLREGNDDQLVLGGLVVSAIAALVAVPWSVVAASGWRRRYRAVRRTGWRAASAVVRPGYENRRGSRNWTPADIHVEFRDGGRLLLGTVFSTHGASWLEGGGSRRVLVGGADQRMVVVFPHGRRRKTPYAVPAYTRSRGKRAD